MSTSRTLFGLLKKEDYFTAKPCNYRVLVDDLYYIEPRVFQPFAKGAQILANHYRDKYGVNIFIVDHSQTIEAGDNIYKRFQHFCADTLTSFSLTNNSAIGFILMHNTHHAVPVLISRENNKNYMIIFDSTSGSRRKGYINIANLVPEYTVLLNDNTRQADNGSCVTDALVILKDALRLPLLGTSIEAHKLVSIDALTPSPDRQSLFAPARLNQPNFSLFKMPEPLLKTAQISSYVENSDADLNVVISRKSETLGQRRARDELTVSFNQHPSVNVGINSFLYKKSLRHAKIIGAEIDKINNSL